MLTGSEIPADVSDLKRRAAGAMPSAEIGVLIEQSTADPSNCRPPASDPQAAD